MGSLRIATFALFGQNASVGFRGVILSSGVDHRFAGVIVEASGDHSYCGAHVGGRFKGFNCAPSVLRAINLHGARIVISTATSIIAVRSATGRSSFVGFTLRNGNCHAFTKTTRTNGPGRRTILLRRIFFIFPRRRFIGCQVCIIIFFRVLLFLLFLG